jgi:hypothetical protein
MELIIMLGAQQSIGEEGMTGRIRCLACAHLHEIMIMFTAKSFLIL